MHPAPGFSDQAPCFPYQPPGFSDQAPGLSYQTSGLSYQTSGFSDQTSGFSSQGPGSGNSKSAYRNPDRSGRYRGNGVWLFLFAPFEVFRLKRCHAIHVAIFAVDKKFVPQNPLLPEPELLIDVDRTLVFTVDDE